MPARSREGPGDPEAAISPGGEGAVRGHQGCPLHLPGRGGRPAAEPARCNREGVPGAAYQNGAREDRRRKRGADGSAAKGKGGV